MDKGKYVLIKLNVKSVKVLNTSGCLHIAERKVDFGGDPMA